MVVTAVAAMVTVVSLHIRRGKKSTIIFKKIKRKQNEIKRMTNLLNYNGKNMNSQLLHQSTKMIWEKRWAVLWNFYLTLTFLFYFLNKNKRHAILVRLKNKVCICVNKWECVTVSLHIKKSLHLHVLCCT